MLIPLSGLTRSRTGLAFAGISVVLAAACGTGAVEPPRTAPQSSGSDATAPDGPLVQQLTEEVSDAGALTHLQALQKIADENGGNRAAGTPGYEASVEYVVGVLRGAGFEVSTPTYEVSSDDEVVVVVVRPRRAATSSPRPEPGTPASS